MEQTEQVKKATSLLKTKKALIASAVCTFLCGLLLLSTSIAWFSDTQDSGANELYAGNLDIELLYSKTMGENSWETVASNTDIFKVNDQNMLWEPGAVNVVYFKVENKGSLAAKYDFTVEIDSEVKGTNFAGTEFKLSDYIKGGVVENITEAYAATVAGRAQARADVESAYNDVKTLQEIHTGAPLLTGTLTGVPDTGTSEKQEKTFALVLYMPENTSSDTNYKTNKPTLKLKVKLIATQTVGETDSFGNQYDKGAYEIKVVVPQDADQSQITNAVVTTIGEANSGESVALPKNVGTIDLTGKTINGNTGVTVVGAEGSTIVFSQSENNEPSVNADGKTFNGVTFDYGNQTYNAIRGTVVYKNCTFNGLVNSYDNSTFINCTFNNTNGQYLAHVYAGSATFTGCTFNGSNRCVYVYTDGADATANFTNCTFTMTSVDKSAIMLNSRNNGETYTVTITNCTQTGGNDQGTASSDGPNYDYRGLYGFKHDPATVNGTVTVDGVIVYNYPA